MLNRPWNNGEGDFSVTFWGSEPGTNDDCYTGKDFKTEKEARECLINLESHFSKDDNEAPYVLLDGPNVHEVTCRTFLLKKAHRKQEEYDSLAKNEFAIQNGMAFGVQGYNDAIGYDSEEWPET